MAGAGKGPQRTCIACRQVLPQEQLVRYVVAPDGKLLVDYRHRLPGRGAYTCCTADCLSTAVVRRQFQRSFRGRCQQLDLRDLREQLSSAVEQKIVNLLGMARKSSQVVSGSNAVMAGLRQQGDFGLVLLAEDISAPIAEKVTSLADRFQVACEKLLNKDLFGQVLGKGERSVVAVTNGPLADAILNELHRYMQLVREN